MKTEAEKFWEEMSIEERTNILRKNNLWIGVMNYIWHYLPNQIQTVVDEEFQKSRR